MISIHDLATREAFARLQADHPLSARVQAHLDRATANGLLDQTHILIIEGGDTDCEVIRELGWSPLFDPISEAPYGTRGFLPYWANLLDLGGWFEILHTIGDSGFAAILLVEDGDSVCPQLRSLCRQFAGVDRAWL